jgi:hypothetical protein
MRYAVALLLAVPLAGQPPDRPARWRADLSIFSHTLKSGQYEFAKRNDVAAFDAEIEVLQRDAATLTDADITLRLMKLVAAANDGHSHVDLPLFAPFRRLPVTVDWYADGLAVTSASPEYSDALGLRVTRIGAMTPEHVLAAAAPYISHENEFALRAESPGYLTTVELLQAIGAADADGRVHLTLERPDGTPVQRTVAPGSPMHWSLIDAFEARHTPRSVTRRHPDQRYYWFEYLPETRAMYVQYNVCENDPLQHFDVFAQTVLSVARSHPVTRWVIDLRENGGGSNRLIGPLREGLAQRAAREPIAVLIGGHTFSAGVDAAIDFKTRLRATLVGGPTGGRPNGFGNAKTMTLPSSHLKVQYSTAYFLSLRSADPPALEPDVAASATLADALAGRDPVLDAALQGPHLLQFSGQWISPGSGISPSSRTSITASPRSPIAFWR